MKTKVNNLGMKHLDTKLNNPIEIEFEYRGEPEDKEEDIRRLKQALEDRFGCPVRDYEPIDEKEEQEAKLRWIAARNRMFEYQFKVKIPDYIEEEK